MKKNFYYINLILFLIYLIFVIKYSFFPLREIDLEIFQQNEFHLHNSRKYEWPEMYQKIINYLNYEVRLLHILLFLPLGIFLKYFIKSGKKLIFSGFAFVLILEILQFIFTQISIKNGFGVYRIFKIEDLFLNFLGFLIGISIFIIIKKIKEKYF